ncbi:MAG: uracil-DNA glycosylase [Betaproteobacteria bacterium]|nr:uracil-DNA glycosylase [Betaproteobacteria bacterium]
MHGSSASTVILHQPGKARVFDPDCTACPRLAGFLAQVRTDHPGYHARPVAPFGAARADLLVVGLAPGMHGANRTGRPFTGDFAGVLLYRTLYKFGFANHAGSADPADRLALKGCRVTNAVKCLPPQNKPAADEVRRCNHFLAAEIAAVAPRALLALGVLAHGAVLQACGLKASAFAFAHGAVHDLPLPVPARAGAAGLRLFDSYHCSRYNTQTRRLTEDMFEAVMRDIAAFLSRSR